MKAPRSAVIVAIRGIETVLYYLDEDDKCLGRRYAPDCGEFGVYVAVLGEKASQAAAQHLRTSPATGCRWSFKKLLGQAGEERLSVTVDCGATFVGLMGASQVSGDDAVSYFEEGE